MRTERRATDSAPTRFRPRRPSQSVLYRCVQQRLETWLAEFRESHDDDGPVPPYVEREFRRHLDGGILARGFFPGLVRAVRARFPDRLLVPDQGRVSLMQRPAHGGDGGHLTDHVLPPLPVRQWVLAVPKRLRHFISRDSHPSEM